MTTTIDKNQWCGQFKRCNGCKLQSECMVTKTAVLVAVEFDRKGDWRMKWATYIPGHPDANDGWIIPGASWKPSHWMLLPEPPQGVNDELA
ncbi:DUF551 domain-containing protein [Escherichia coli]|nr:DUF551 domain-containing protein [Escherichia coli]